MSRPSLRPVALLLVPLLACASASGGNDRLSGSVLTRQDLTRSTENDLFDVLKNHPDLRVVESPSTGRSILTLGTRGSGHSLSAGGARPMLLVLDGSRIRNGAVALLRDLELSAVERVEILRPAEAGSRYGTGSGSGVLVVETRR